MTQEILQAAGFADGVTCAQAVFLHPPTVPFVVWFDNVTADGSDDGCEVTEHAVTLELYSQGKPSPACENALEGALRARGRHYEKTGRTWIQSERYFLTVYSFVYFEKEANNG